MTQKSRFFLVASAVVLLLGVGGGLIAYLNYRRAASLPAGVPQEVRYVPADAAIVAYGNVRVFMNSDLRRELMPTIEMGSRKGRQMMDDFAGIDLEKQVDHVLGYVESQESSPEGTADPGRPSDPPNAMALVQGSFDQSRVEQFIRDRGSVIETYNGHHIAVHRDGKDEVAVGFVRPDLIAVGRASLVRRALDLPTGDATQPQDLTSNAELMNLIRDMSGSTAWVVGHFDAVRRGMKLPNTVSSQVPPVRLVSVRADVNGGVKATLRVETDDQAAAEQLREVVRGFIALARLQAGAKPEFDNVLKSVQLSGTDKTIQLSVAASPEIMRALAPHPRPNREPRNPEPNAEPRNPEPRNPEPRNP
jgi:hypothetical protein